MIRSREDLAPRRTSSRSRSRRSAAVCGTPRRRGRRGARSEIPPVPRSSSSTKLVALRRAVRSADARVVLRGRAHHRRPADVDLLDQLVVADAAPRGHRGEGVEVDARRGRSARCRRVEGLDGRPARRAREDAAVDFGVEGLDAPVEHLGVAGDLASTMVTGRPASRSASAVPPVEISSTPRATRPRGEVHEPGLVGDRDRARGETFTVASAPARRIVVDGGRRGRASPRALPRGEEEPRRPSSTMRSCSTASMVSGRSRRRWSAPRASPRRRPGRSARRPADDRPAVERLVDEVHGHAGHAPRRPRARPRSRARPGRTAGATGAR